MKRLNGTAQAAVEASIEECLALLAAIEAYPEWYPEVVKEVAVLERNDDGLALMAETKLRLAYGPVSRDIDLLLAVRVSGSDLIELKHVSRGASSGASFDVTWRLEDRAGTALELELDATMPVPRLVPTNGVGDSFATGFMQAAVRRLQSGF